MYTDLYVWMYIKCMYELKEVWVMLSISYPDVFVWVEEKGV